MLSRLNTRMLWAFASLCLLLVLVACSKSTETNPTASEESKESSSEQTATPSKTSEDFVTLDESPGPNDKKYLEAARPFAVALAKGDYATAYQMLSSHARAKANLGQFQEGKTDEELKTLHETVYTDLTPEKFAELMKTVESLHGTPSKPLNLHVQATDAPTLSGETGGEVNGIDVMLAIGNMPAEIPKDIRKASLRGRTATTLNDEALAQTAKDMNMTVEELKKLEDFQPYYNYKIVLVEENGELKVGYFEFMQPSMFD